MKKNALIDITVLIIAGVLASAVILGVSYTLYTNVSEEGIVEQCRTSYLAAHLVKSTTADFARGRIDCPVQDVKIKDAEDVVKGLRDCWYKTLGMKNKIGNIKYDIDTRFCLVCAEFTPSEDISVQDVKTVINSGTSKRDGMTYNSFLEDPNSNSLDRFFLKYKKVEEVVAKPFTFLKGNTTYWIVSKSYGDVPSMFVSDIPDARKARCSVLHYQKEDKIQ